MRWGLVPRWAREVGSGQPLINARSETVAEKPSFRDSYRERRCLVVADGFYEWHAAGRRKQPYWIGLSDGRPFGFAGLWDRWKAPDGKMVESCTILTTEATEALRELHDRMPVIVEPEHFDLWMDPDTIPDTLSVMAWTEYNGGHEIMGIRHQHLNVQGVQFHPESILTTCGHDLLKNFLQSISKSY